MVRLIAVQGPTQLLNVISVLRFQEATERHQDCQDVLVIGGLYTASHSPAVKNLLETCLRISKAWNFKARFTLLELEQLFEAGAIDFTTALSLLKRQLASHHISTIDTIYNCRNWQFFNEILLSAYPDAHKICYGDGFGFLDLVSNTGSRSSISPAGFIAIDDAYLITPVEVYEDALSKCCIHLVEPSFFQSVIRDSIQHFELLKNDFSNRLQQSHEPFTIVLTTNGTEAGIYKDLIQEIESYFHVILNYTDPDETILVKGHPRETYHQSELLAYLLRSYGRNASSVVGFECVPIELFTSFLPIKKALTFYSSSCAGLAYLCQDSLETVVVGLGKRSISHYVTSSYQELLYYEEVNAVLVQQAYQQTFSPITVSSIKEELDSSKHFNQEPICFQNCHRVLNSQVKVNYSKENSMALNVSELPILIAEFQKLKSDIDLETDYQVIDIKTEFIKFQKTELIDLNNQNQLLQTQLSVAQTQLGQVHNQTEAAQLQIQEMQLQIKRLQTKRNRLAAQLRDTQAMVVAMQSSKFWKLREQWVKFKQFLRLSRPQEITSAVNYPQAQDFVHPNDLQHSAIKSPLTGSFQVTLLNTIDTAQLIQDWKDSFQIDITEELRNHDKIYLYQCDRTKLKFFLPAEIVGSENLYKQLERFDWYYMSDKWEYQVALKDLKGLSKILEVGSGRGHFIQLGTEQGLDIRGLELNADAVAIAQQKGLTVEQLDLETVAKQYPESFDAVCSFQVLEHVSNPKDFIQWSIQLLKPNGKLIFCVPNSESFLKYQYCLLDMPPHHVLQWSEVSFRALEQIFSVKLETVRYEPLATYHVLGYLHTYSDYFRSRSPLGKLVFNSHTLPFFEKILNFGLRHFLKGQSLYVQFRKC